MHVLLVDPSPKPALPDAAKFLSHEGWTLDTVADYRAALDATRDGSIDAVILAAPTDGPSPDRADYNAFVHHLDSHRIMTLVLTDDPRRARPSGDSLVELVDRRIGAAELRGRLAMIERYHRLLKRMERELHEMDRLGQRLHEHFRSVDQEMRLAGRLQRDFLPDCTCPIGPAQFASIFRPASWVSGDMFDVVRIDEHHSGIYVADAVGHGLAASLLTMFIKRAIVPTREAAGGIKVLGPSEVLSVLNDALADQRLPNCQFVTACYAVLDHQTGLLRYGRAGHPAPVHIKADGSMRRLETTGGLLGLFRGESFSEGEVLLQPGDKVIFYTDGVEFAFPHNQPGPQAGVRAVSLRPEGPKKVSIGYLRPEGERSLPGASAPDATLSITSSARRADEATLPIDDSDLAEPSEYERIFQRLAHLPIGEMMTSLEEEINAGTGSLAPKDDITILGMEILAS